MPAIKYDPDPVRIQAATELLLQLWRGELQLSELPVHAKPRNLADAQQVCDAVTAQLDAPILGWKYYFSYKAQEHPFRSAIYRVFDSGETIPKDVSALRLIEPELVFRVLKDLPPQTRAYGHDEVADALEAMPAFELIGPRYTYESHDDLRRRIAGARSFDRMADHNSCGAFVLGRARRDWRELDLWKMHVTMRQGTRTLVDTIGGHPFVDPFLPLFVLANDMRGREGLKAGQILATSSYSGFYQVDAGRPVISEFSGFDDIETTFER